MSKHTVKFDGGRYSVLCDGVVVDELPLHQETEQLRAELDAARDAERAATEAWKRLLGDEAKARAELDDARRLRERIAKTMGSEPDDDDDLVECVRIVVEQLDAANADRARLGRAVELARDWSEPFRGAPGMSKDELHNRMLAALAESEGCAALASSGAAQWLRERERRVAEKVWRSCVSSRELEAALGASGRTIEQMMARSLDALLKEET